MKLREMSEHDLTQVLAIEKALFVPPWNEEQFLYELHDNPFAQLYVVEQDDQIVAYMDVWITFETAQLANIAVMKTHQRQGIAKMMMDAMIKQCEAAMCENITLEVRIDNKAAICLYQAYGFIEVNIRKQYYEDGTDAYLMMKALGGNYL